MRSIVKRTISLMLVLATVFTLMLPIQVHAATLKKGSKGAAVKKLQLNLIGFGYLASGGDDGDYGNNTLNAVKSFQEDYYEIYGLKINGKADDKTQKALRTEVKRIQMNLIGLGYLAKNQDDGVYGNNTKKAVKKFQEAHGLKAKGIVNQKTRTRIYSEVSNLQDILINQLGCLDGIADGIYGSKTKSAVKKFQKQAEYNHKEKLAQDGIAGPKTMAAISWEFKIIQNRLSSLGYDVKTTGKYDSKTKKAIRQFLSDIYNSDCGVEWDGVADESVRDAIRSCYFNDSNC